MRNILKQLATAMTLLTVQAAYSQVISETNVTVRVNGTVPSSFKWNGTVKPLIAGYGEANTGYANINLMMAAKTASVFPVYSFKRSRGTLAGPGVVQINDPVGSIWAYGYDGTAFQGSASADFFVDGVPAAGNVPMRFSIYTGSSSINRVERLKIGSTGNFNFNNNQLFLQSSTGRLGIGTLTPGGQLELSLDQARKPGTSTWTIVSDSRLKDVIGTYKKGLDAILKLNPISYRYKNTGDRLFSEDVLATVQVGFTAQEVKKVFPEAVATDEDGYLNFNMHPILIASINAFKELKSQLDEKEKLIANQQKQLDRQQAQIDLLMQKFNSLERQQAECCSATQARTVNQNETVTTSDISSLQQNAPNPFNSSTTIKFRLASSVRSAQLVITDVRGVILKTIGLNVPGDGQVTLNSGTLSPGTYLYTLVADGQKLDTKEMQIIK